MAIAALEQVGLIARDDGVVRPMADRIGVEIRL
jgi:hypothetical protein